ncbi:MAG: STAS domain-containing protein [Anaerolineae bacterium]
MNIWQKTLPTNIEIVYVNGRLDQTLTPQLETVLNEILTQEQEQIIVDLSQVNYINSGGLRCLVSAWRKARQQSGDLKLSGLNARLSEIFGMVGFDKVFHIHATPEQAQRAFTEPSEQD